MTCLSAMLTWLLATIGMIQAPQGTGAAGVGAMPQCSCALDDDGTGDSAGDDPPAHPRAARARGDGGSDIYNGF